MNCKIIGYVTGTTKKGSPYTILHGVFDFNEYEKLNGAQGQKVMDIYVPFPVPNLTVGSSAVIVYGVGFGGKAVVTDVKIIK